MYINVKGKNGELEFAKWLEENLDLEKKLKRNIEQVREGGADITCLKPFLFEVKRCEKLDLFSWWGQIKRAADNYNKQNKILTNNDFRMPIVAFRQNRKKWEFLISASNIGLEFGFIRITERIFLEWAKNILCS